MKRQITWFDVVIFLGLLLNMPWTMLAIGQYTPSLPLSSFGFGSEFDFKWIMAFGSTILIEAAIMVAYRWAVDDKPDNFLQKILMGCLILGGFFSMYQFRLLDSSEVGGVVDPELLKVMPSFVAGLPILALMFLMGIDMLKGFRPQWGWLPAILQSTYTANSQMPGKQRGQRYQEPQPSARPKSRDNDTIPTRPHVNQQQDARRRAFDPGAGLATGAYQQVGDIPPIPGTRIPVEDHDE